MCAGIYMYYIYMYSCMDLSIRVLFLYSGKVTLIRAGVLSGMSPLFGTKGETVL